ncbi:LysR family transcriptional regulator [Sneathiella glossodoripedis]|uniref:LysR family transcriptional regulator n=1 Tax=Sneathiella glossodoripedis TaxID=418853 RepID=UPI000470D8C7|nr:LysR family transcriptional regulator [Sneathiella glossodoripedis]
MGKLEDMALFAKIVESGSITAAANQMGMAKSAVSKKLADLEKQIGTQLINRTTRKSSLTESGQLYYNQSQKILQDTDDLLAVVGSSKSELSGALRVGAPLSFGLKHLSPVISQFARKHPSLSIDLSFADHQVNLIEDGIDVAIRIANLEPSSLVARRFTTIRHCICASPDYLLKYGEPEHPSELASHKILRYKSPSGLSHVISDNNGEQYEVPTQSVLMSNNGDFLKSAALDGLGLYFCPTFLCSDDLKTGLLVPVLREFSLVELGAYIIYPQTRYLSSRVRHFIDHVVKSFADPPHWDLDTLESAPLSNSSQHHQARDKHPL